MRRRAPQRRNIIKKMAKWIGWLRRQKMVGPRRGMNGPRDQEGEDHLQGNVSNKNGTIRFPHLAVDQRPSCLSVIRPCTTACRCRNAYHLTLCFTQTLFSSYYLHPLLRTIRFAHKIQIFTQPYFHRPKDLSFLCLFYSIKVAVNELDDFTIVSKTFNWYRMSLLRLAFAESLHSKCLF